MVDSVLFFAFYLIYVRFSESSPLEEVLLVAKIVGSFVPEWYGHPITDEWRTVISINVEVYVKKNYSNALKLPAYVLDLPHFRSRDFQRKFPMNFSYRKLHLRQYFSGIDNFLLQ